MRLTPAEVRALRTAFRDSPDLEKRLALGEWSALKLGEVVAEGCDAVLHAPLILSPNHQLAIGWDGGHTPSAVIGQLINNQVRIYAALNDMKAGVLQLIEEQVAPWLIQYAPWARHGGGGLTRVGSASRGDPPRLGPRTEGGVVPLAISPVRETELLRTALGSRWYYPRTPAIQRHRRCGRVPLRVAPAGDGSDLRETQAEAAEEVRPTTRPNLTSGGMPTYSVTERRTDV